MRAITPTRVFWLSLALAYAGLGTYWTMRAPAGVWGNRILDFPMWSENDPGGWYIPAAHDLLAQPGRSCFPGHPGTPLQFWLYVQQVALFGVGRLAGTPLDFTPFIAKHVFDVWVVAKLSMVAVSFVSLIAMYHFALSHFERRDVALGAVVVFATSFPVLYYLNRVSPEPMMNALFLWTWAAVAWASNARTPPARAPLWAAGAGACAAAALFTKMQLMAPLPIFAGLALLMGRSANGIQGGERRRVVLAYVAGVSVAAAFLWPFVDWAVFMSSWQRSLPGPRATGGGFFYRMVGEVAASLTTGLAQAKPSALLPAATQSGCFFLFELLFLPAGVLGWARALRARATPRRMSLWLLAHCACVVAVWWHRAGGKDFHGFHYLFPLVAVLSPFVAYAALGSRPALVDAQRSLTRRIGEAAILVAALHFFAIFAVIHSKAQDHDSFLAMRSSHYFSALRRAAPGKGVAVFGRIPYLSHGLSQSYTLLDRESRLMAALAAAHPFEKGPVDCALFTRRARRRGASLILDFNQSDPGPRTWEEWNALPLRGRCVI